MAAQNDFLAFATAGGANVITQSQYAAMSTLPGGFVQGLAQSAQLNKVWRQSSTISAAIATIAANAGYPMIDDGVLATKVTGIQQAFGAGAAPITTSVTALRSLLKTGNPNTFVTSYNAPLDGGGGAYTYDSTDTTSGAFFTGSISGTVLTVSAVTNGTLAVGQVVYGVAGMGVGIYIVSLGTGTGGTGTYNLNASLTITSETMTADNGGSIIVALDGGRWKLIQSYPWSVKQFGAKGDGANDDARPINSALGALGAGGGAVTVPAGAACSLASNLTIPPSCHLIGPHKLVGTPGNNVAANYLAVKGSLTPISAATITVGSGASISGLLIYRNGMTFPAADSSLFAGTAVTIGGDDASVFNCLIMGFSRGVYSSNYQRPRIEYLLLDNLNGIEITACADVPYVSNCHAWPFATIAAGAAGTKDTRSGIAYNFHDLVDWGKFTNCFSWGYYRGIVVNNASSCQIIGGGDDNYNIAGVPQLANSIGIEILGTAQDTRLLFTQTAAQATAGVHVNVNAGLETTILGHNTWGGSTHGVLVDGGDVMVHSCTLRNVTNGVSINNASSRVFIDHNRFQQVTGNPILVNVATNLVYIGDNNDFGDFTGTVAGSNLTSPAIASASVITLPNSGKTFRITGAVNVGSINGGYAGRVVWLKAEGSFSFLTGTGSSNQMRLQSSANFAVTSGSMLGLYHDGVQFWAFSQVP